VYRILMFSLGGFALVMVVCAIPFAILRELSRRQKRISYTQIRLAQQAIAIEQNLAEARSAAASVTDPKLSVHLSSLVDSCEKRLANLFEGSEGLDGVGRTDLGGKVAERLILTGNELAADLRRLSHATDECQHFESLEGEPARSIARAIIAEE